MNRPLLRAVAPAPEPIEEVTIRTDWRVGMITCSDLTIARRYAAESGSAIVRVTTKEVRQVVQPAHNPAVLASREAAS